MLTRAWIAAARARQLSQRPRGGWPPREELIRRYAPGRSFADIGCMWGIDGGLSFLAEECGATSVTGVDELEPTATFKAEHARRHSKVRFVHGDLHEPHVKAEVGRHDVVWCYGVLYHVPSPLLTLECLRDITEDLLILGTRTIPELPVQGGAVFYPGLSARSRRAYQAMPPRNMPRLGISRPFDPSLHYRNWWWGFSRSALLAMLDVAGFEVVETQGHQFHTLLVARVVDRRPLHPK